MRGKLATNLTIVEFAVICHFLERHNMPFFYSISHLLDVFKPKRIDFKIDKIHESNKQQPGAIANCVSLTSVYLCPKFLGLPLLKLNTSRLITTLTAES